MNKEVKALNKITLIGPVYPYKGGIAHYTGALYQALSKQYTVEMISYQLQYPKFLFQKEQKDFQNKLFQIKDTNFIINTINPFSWIKTVNYIIKTNPDLIIIQWWHPYFSPCYWFMTLLLSKVKKVFICHNVFPHESFPFDWRLTKGVLTKGDGFVVQSGKDLEDLKSIVKTPKAKLAVHPNYNIFKFVDMDKRTARQGLELQEQEKVILFFGFVREYKGLKHLIKAMPKVKEAYQDIKLLIVGEFGSDKEEYIDLINKNMVMDYLQIYDGYIPDVEIQKYFMAADIVILPYESATQSGIVQMAYGFEKPVIVTAVGGLPEVVKNNKTGYIVPPQDSEELAKAIIRFYDEDKEEEFICGVKEEAKKFSWDRMTELITELYTEL